MCRDAEGAKELLYKSIELSPTRGHGKYVLLGHLDCGTSAIASFEKALEILELEVRHVSLSPLLPQLRLERSCRIDAGCGSDG